MPGTVSMTVNGKAVSADVEDRALLVEYLRDHLGLTETHVGCDTSQCGACVVHVEGVSVKACTMLARQAEGATVVTIEGPPTARRCIPCRRRSATITAYNAASARRAW